MSPAYAYTPQIWPPLLTIVLLIALAVYAWRHRNVPGALPFAIGCLIAVVWAFGTVMEYAALQVPQRILWLKVQAVTQLPCVTAMALFILEYVWPGRWRTRRYLLLLSIAPLHLIAVVLTDPLFHLMWRGFSVNGGVVLPVRAPLGWALVAYGYLLGLSEVGAFLWLYAHSPRHRWPVAIMLAGHSAARVLYLADQRADLYAIVIPLATYGVALFAFRILDANVLAREAALSGMRDGMLVLDPSRRVASLNRAAEATFGLKEAKVRGHDVDSLLPGHPALVAVIAAARDGAAEFSLGAGAEARHHQLSYSRLRDFRGLHSGELFLLHDITEQRRAQQQMLEQQWALAALQEREQLARELHDSIGQVLGYAGLQTDTVDTLLERGQVSEARLVINRLTGVLREAHADIRQQIMDLRATPSPQDPFLDVIRHYLSGYSANYGIATVLQAGGGLDDGLLSPEARVHLYRILQEALTNVRKHSGASRVQVTFASPDDQVEMRIEDNGRGFDAALAAHAAGGHYGLGYMQARAEQLGGALAISAAPGGGTSLSVTVPVGGDRDARASG